MKADTMGDRQATPVVIDGVAALRERAGSPLGTSRWVTIDQDMVNEFAKLTGDCQWIHVNPDRAKDGPFGATVAHGFLTLSLATGLLEDVFTIKGVGTIVNYGLNRVRFPAPLLVGCRVCMHVAVAEAVEIQGGIQVVYHLEFEAEGQARPCCIADLVFRYYGVAEPESPLVAT